MVSHLWEAAQQKHERCVCVRLERVSVRGSRQPLPKTIETVQEARRKKNNLPKLATAILWAIPRVFSLCFTRATNVHTALRNFISDQPLEPRGLQTSRCFQIVSNGQRLTHLSYCFVL